ncbi:hypothetical protein CBE79_27405 [Priestia megaterium]|nr:hypothetical protein CBE78_27180 [Priestia megaterium]TPF19389.1 hypothetical protein CBE79_27405 [Priestia megaterium]
MMYDYLHFITLLLSWPTTFNYKEDITKGNENDGLDNKQHAQAVNTYAKALREKNINYKLLKVKKTSSIYYLSWHRLYFI